MGKWYNACSKRVYEEIRDFAKLNEFKITPPAEDILSKAEEEENSHIKTLIKKADIKKEKIQSLPRYLKFI